MFRQDPGDENSLGIVKINFPSPDGVYMHDTPHKGLFNDDYRFDSSGCVRIQNIRELITWMLRTRPGWTPRRGRRRAAQSASASTSRWPTPVPLYWIYITAWATTDGVVNFRNDIYNLDGLDQLTPPQPARRSTRPRSRRCHGRLAGDPAAAPLHVGSPSPAGRAGQWRPATPC